MIFPKGLSAAIGYKDNVLEETLCLEIIDYVENHTNMMYEGPTIGGLNKAIKNCYDFGLGYHNNLATSDGQREELGRFNDLVFERFTPALEEYCLYFDGLGDWKNRYDTGYQFQKYLPNEGFYKSHCDGGVYLEAPNSSRVLGVVMYLNTVEEGGGTEFPLHEVTINAVCGRVSFFPANFTHPHAGLMPIGQPKYILSTFCFHQPDSPEHEAFYSLADNYAEAIESPSNA